ncbi:hypothetical protein BDR26DRAFT_870955 [Obelidium mucronatum]|nr:hypothetical protein BDR26DRAFT_870955 [Obelidium mucronatum]
MNVPLANYLATSTDQQIQSLFETIFERKLPGFSLETTELNLTEPNTNPTSIRCKRSSCDASSLKATIAECNYSGGESQRGPEGGLPAELRELTASRCELFGFSDPELVRVWMDAQARPLLVVTPKRHEVGALWRVVGEVIQGYGWGEFKEVVLNAGRFRNIEHAHVKVWFEDSLFLERVVDGRRQLFNQLHELRRLMKLPKADLLRKSLDGCVGDIGLTVKGCFEGDCDRKELIERFSEFGKVVCVYIPGDTNYERKEDALVMMEDPEAVVQAAVHLNLRRFGKNVSCKVKIDGIN